MNRERIKDIAAVTIMRIVTVVLALALLGTLVGALIKDTLVTLVILLATGSMVAFVWALDHCDMESLHIWRRNR